MEFPRLKLGWRLGPAALAISTCRCLPQGLCWNHRPPKLLTKPPPNKKRCCAEKLPLWDLQILKAPYKREVSRILKLGSLSFQTTSLRGNLKCFALSCLRGTKTMWQHFLEGLRVVKNLHQCCWSSPHHFRLRCRGQQIGGGHLQSWETRDNPASLSHSRKHTGKWVSSRFIPGITLNQMNITNLKMWLQLSHFTY